MHWKNFCQSNERMILLQPCRDCSVGQWPVRIISLCYWCLTRWNWCFTDRRLYIPPGRFHRFLPSKQQRCGEHPEVAGGTRVVASDVPAEMWDVPALQAGAHCNWQPTWCHLRNRVLSGGLAMPVWQQTVHAVRMMAFLLEIDYQLISLSRNPCQSLSCCLFVSHSPTKNPSSKNDYLSLRRRRLCGLASSTKSS